MKFKDKIVVISGAATGIGYTSASMFADAGAKVTVLDISEPSHDIKNITYIKCDVSSLKQVQTSINRVYKEYGKIDILFCNAGAYFVGNIEETSEEIIDQILGINFKGIYFMLKSTLPIMRKQQQGNIILMGSDQCFIGKSKSSIYGATKGAIGQLTKSTAIDYAEYNIRVNCICPGTIDTPLVDKVANIWHDQFGTSPDEVKKFFASNHLFKRIGKPEEIAKVVLFLASDDSSFMTGSLIPVDAGYTAG